MKIGQAFKMAVKSILAKKGRSFLTMLGIIIGIASVMTIVATLNGSNQKQREYYESQGTNKVEAYGYLYYSNESMYDILRDYCQSMGDLVVGITPNSYAWGLTVKYGAKSSDSMEYSPNLYLGSEQYSACNNFTIAKGRDLCYLDIKNYNTVCVLGARAAKNFFDYSDPIGKVLTIGGKPFTVVGVYAEKDPDNAWSLDNVIVMPYTITRFYPDQGFDTSEISIKCKDKQSVKEVIARVQIYINSLTKNGETGWGYAYSNQEWMDSDNEYMTMLSLVLGGIAGISLLVGGIGIMNIMLVTVTERTREIGIRRAIGAQRSSIVVQFLMEAAMLCGFGGLIGIGIGYGLTNLAGRLLLDGMSIVPATSITIGAFAFSVGLGVIFGMYPAIKASGLQPVVALRAE